MESSQTVDLSGRVALVTGAAHRLGRALALSLADAGADILVHCHTSRDEADDLAREIKDLGRRARVVVADLADEAAVNAAFGEATEAIGGARHSGQQRGRIIWKSLDRIPAGRYGTYEDIAHAVRHLASGGASYVTGTHIKVSGGDLV